MTDDTPAAESEIRILGLTSREIEARFREETAHAVRTLHAAGLAAYGTDDRGGVVALLPDGRTVGIADEAPKPASLGGHGVPEEDVRRRYGRSLTNLPSVLTIVDSALLFDNSLTGEVTLVAEFSASRLV